MTAVLLAVGLLTLVTGAVTGLVVLLVAGAVPAATGPVLSVSRRLRGTRLLVTAVTRG